VIIPGQRKTKSETYMKEAVNLIDTAAVQLAQNRGCFPGGPHEILNGKYKRTFATNTES